MSLSYVLFLCPKKLEIARPAGRELIEIFVTVPLSLDRYSSDDRFVTNMRLIMPENNARAITDSASCDLEKWLGNA
jgi:hypothetical protein